MCGQRIVLSSSTHEGRVSSYGTIHQTSQILTADLEPPTLFLNFEFESWETLLGSVLIVLGEAFSNFTSLDLQLPAMHLGLIPCLFCASKLTRFTNISAMMTKNLLSQIQIMRPTGRIPFRLHALSCSLMMSPCGELLIKRLFHSRVGDESLGNPL